MTTQAPTNDLQQLTRTVAALAEALARSERRHTQMGRALRWGTLALVTLLGGAAALFGGRFGVAYAQQTGAFPEAASAVEALNNINRNLAIFGMLGETVGEGLTEAMLSNPGLQQQVAGYLKAHGLAVTEENMRSHAAHAAMVGSAKGMAQLAAQIIPAVNQAIQDNPDVQSQVRGYLQTRNIPITEENMMTYAGPAVMEAAVKAVVGTVVVIDHITEDSQNWHDYIKNPTPVLEGLQRELQAMNLALASVPAMVVQMDFMNRNMASMTHSMGTSMGRMGSWLP
jgi:hypothetical protein